MSHLLTLHDPARARENYRTGAWRPDTLYSLARGHAMARGARHAVRDSHRRLDWRGLLAWVDAVAADLHEAGLRSGDRVSVWLPNRVETFVVMLACSRNGYVCNPSLHQNYTVAEIVALLGRIECRALFAQPGWGADAGTADIFAQAGALEHMKRVYALPSLALADAALPAATRPMPTGPAPSIANPPANENPDKIVYLAFTSGTTGTPKGVMHSDNTLLANGRALVSDWRQGPDTVLLSLSPMSHHIATVAMEQTLVGGFELAMLPQDCGIGVLDWIETTGATYVMGVPTHAMDLMAELDRRGLKQLGSVRTFYMAGAPIPEQTANAFLALGVTPQNIYGMTENGSHQYTRPDDTADVISGTCGKACLGYEIRLWREDRPDEEAAPGEIGEIGGRGGLLMLGYYGDQQASEHSFNAQGWFLSGDLGQFDAAGNLRVVGRKKDLIIRGGHNIHPARIENLAMRHPKVAKAAAFAVADERLGEKVCLAVLPALGAQPSAEELLAHLGVAGLSKFDMPEYFISLPEFPLTPSGKILKRELARWIGTGRISPSPVRFVQTRKGP